MAGGVFLFPVLLAPADPVIERKSVVDLYYTRTELRKKLRLTPAQIQQLSDPDRIEVSQHGRHCNLTYLYLRERVHRLLDELRVETPKPPQPHAGGGCIVRYDDGRMCAGRALWMDEVHGGLVCDLHATWVPQAAQF